MIKSSPPAHALGTLIEMNQQGKDLCFLPVFAAVHIGKQKSSFAKLNGKEWNKLHTEDLPE